MSREDSLKDTNLLLEFIQNARRNFGDSKWNGENTISGDSGSRCILCNKTDGHTDSCIIPILPDPWKEYALQSKQDECEHFYVNGMCLDCGLTNVDSTG